MEKVTCKTQREFIEEVANDCVKNMSQKDKAYLIENPYGYDYHFTYCLYIRNQYIHCSDFSEVEWDCVPDNLSHEIIRYIFSILLPEYDYDNFFVTCTYDDRKFIELRKEYKRLFGEYPDFMVKKYSDKINIKPFPDFSELKSMSDEEFDNVEKEYKKNCKKMEKVKKALICELLDIIWQKDKVIKKGTDYGIDKDSLLKDIDKLKEFFFSEEKYIPLETVFIPYRNKINEKDYIEYREMFKNSIGDSLHSIVKLDKKYFSDRVLAKEILICAWVFDYLPEYKNDEEIVRNAIMHYGNSIENVDKRFQKDREWVKLAIEHSTYGVIMHPDCMKPYRKDKELVYMACKVERQNFAYIDKSFRDDYELAKICMEQKRDNNSIYRYMSPRLRDLKEFALLKLEETCPDVEHFSRRLKNDDEIAAKLFEIHGTTSWEWEYMSKRLQKKYGIEFEY